MANGPVLDSDVLIDYLRAPGPAWTSFGRSPGGRATGSPP
jgi:hypothetical protein